MVAKNKGRKGQAAIETAFSLPFLIWLIYYTINAFHSIHTAHIGQKSAAMDLYRRIDNRAKFVVDEVAGTLHGKNFMAVEYIDPEGGPPKRKLLISPAANVSMESTVGICREPDCR